MRRIHWNTGKRNIRRSSHRKTLSDDSLYRRFISSRKYMHHERLQELVIIDYTKETAIVAIVGDEDNKEIAGVGRFFIDESRHSAEAENNPMLHVFEKGGFDIVRHTIAGICEMTMAFKE